MSSSCSVEQQSDSAASSPRDAGESDGPGADEAAEPPGTR